MKDDHVSWQGQGDRKYEEEKLFGDFYGVSPSLNY